MAKTAKRLERLRRLLPDKGIDAAFISQPENRLYLSGFTGSAGFLLITKSEAVLATDFRYVEQVKRQSPDFRLFQIEDGIADWLPEILDGLGIKRLGIESEHISLAMVHGIRKALGKLKTPPEAVPTEGLIEALRAIKEPAEIELIARAASISDGAMEYIIDFIRPGMTERQVAWEIEKYMREHGSQPLPFDAIVASGLNSAMPHAMPSERPVEEGEPVVIDIGARVEGYCSDITRTICLGEKSGTFRKIYESVLDAQRAAMAIIRENIGGDEADSSARRVIDRAGYKEAFGHSLGHGIGLAPHESPRLGPKSKDVLATGMVFSIEPGIYLPGWGGVRIEDLVALNEDYIRPISNARKGLT